jgi:hypothetical protein
LDVFNVSNLIGNWFGQSWGERYFVGSGDNSYTFELLQFEGFEYEENGFTRRPVFSFNEPGEPWDVDQSPTAEGSRWAAQVGLRYSF